MTDGIERIGRQYRIDCMNCGLLGPWRDTKGKAIKDQVDHRDPENGCYAWIVGCDDIDEFEPGPWNEVDADAEQATLVAATDGGNNRTEDTGTEQEGRR